MSLFDQVTLRKDHILQHKTFKITSFLQSLICLLSQNLVSEEASNMLKEILHIDLSAKQFQRVSEYYGGQLDPIIEANHTEYIPAVKPSNAVDEHTYIMLDRNMIYTREESWKENKLARIFQDSKNIEIQRNRNEIVDTVYVSHLGGIETFLPKLERHISLVNGRKVFIADGAKWIWNWVEGNYPGAIQILDFYHAKEKLAYIGQYFIKDEIKRFAWIEQQSSLLLDDKVHEVIESIKTLRSPNQKAKDFRGRVLNYYELHEDRMMYKTYKDKGLLIGSGPIEAAHRNVIQQRLKLSGQKWSIDGANAIANLRCYQKSNAWPLIDKLIKLAA